jgi:hypothetical protein
VIVVALLLSLGLITASSQACLWLHQKQLLPAVSNQPAEQQKRSTNGFKLSRKHSNDQKTAGLVGWEWQLAAKAEVKSTTDARLVKSKAARLCWLELEGVH